MTETFLSPLKRGHWIIKATEKLLETVIIIIDFFCNYTSGKDCVWTTFKKLNIVAFKNAGNSRHCENIEKKNGCAWNLNRSF